MKSKQLGALLITLTILFFNLHVQGQIIKIVNTSDTSQNGNSEINNIPVNPDFCGTDFFHNQKMKNDAQYKARHIKTIQTIQKRSSQKNKLPPNSILQVPVVVHVMHKGESVGSGTNISDEDVKRGVKYLNNYWRKVEGSEGNGDGVDMKIEFALAVQDENGDCTNGIDRVDMSGVATYVSNGVNVSSSDGLDDYAPGGGINSLKEYSIWDSTQYYNVWIVDEIDNENCNNNDGGYTGGYASFASSHGSLWDGSVVLICSYLNESSSTWAHEMGHAFNLLHTFDGDDSDGDGVGDQCGDDGIFDTPSHIRTSSISPSIYSDCNNNDTNTCDPTFNQITNPDAGISRNTGTHQDHMHNYMDYTGCPNEFTGGQRTEVRAALNSTRASFLSSPALTPPSLATVYFTSTVTNICLGGSMTFNDESTCTPNTYTNTGYDNITFLWSFDNNVDTPYTSTNQNPTITFDNSGVYDVTLTITNPEGTTSLTKAGSLSVTSGVNPACSASSDSNNDGDFGIGVTNVSFNTLNNSTSTFIPASGMNDFTCSDNTTVHVGTPYTLQVNYKTSNVNDGPVYVDVWIDWDNSGAFETSNSNGINEKVLTDNITAGTTGFPSVSVTPPATVTLNTLLRMRVVSELDNVPTVCGNGYIQRADDYGIYVKPICTAPTAGITNNSGVTELTCSAPSINLTATGGESYLWDNNKGITPTISITQPGTYTVIVTALDGCTDTESIVITEDKPAPTAGITNNTGETSITCSTSSISLTATGGVSYSWDNGLGNDATVLVTESGIYTVTVTSVNSCTDTESIVILDEKTTAACPVSSFNNDGDFGVGVTNMTFNAINNNTTTFIPADAMNDFVCSYSTTLTVGTPYNLDVTYKSTSGGGQFLEVWIDWDNDGDFQTSNSNGNNEMVLSDNIAGSSQETPSASVTAPAAATLNTLLRMRVISEYNEAPAVCGNGFGQRADDYGVIVSSTLGLAELSSSEFKIYPNPVKYFLNISLENNGLIKGFEVYDITGKKVMFNSGSTKNSINVSNLSNGFYFLKVETDTGKLISRFIKE
jgi:PKD repeat protein